MTGGRSSLLGLIVTAVIAVPSAALVMQRTLETEPRRQMELTASNGALTISNSLEGEAILTAAPMVPGTSTTGTVTLKNTGDSAEKLTLDAGAPVDTPGPGGGLLSERLRLRVDAVTAGGATTTVYSGALAALDLAELGTLERDEARTYRFVVTFPDGGANGADNAYQGSSASIGFEWIITSAGPPTPPASAPLEQQIAADSPMGYWPLDGSTAAMDDIAGSHPGSYANSVTTAQGSAPGGGLAAAFDGASSYGYVNGVAAPTSAYTMEAWAKPAAARDMTILEHGAGGSLTIEGGRFVFRHLGAFVGSVTGSSATRVTVGRWHQVVGSWDAASGTGRLYVNGVLLSEGSAPGTPSGSATFFVGRGNTLADSFFAGAIAQVSYFRSSLGADRILAHFNAGQVTESDPTPSDPNPSTPSPPSNPEPSTPGSGEPPAGDTPPGEMTVPQTPPTTCPGTVTAQGGESSIWAILNARARAKAADRAKALAKARARARSKANGKSRGKKKRPRAIKKSNRSTCAGVRTKGSNRSG